MNDNKIIETLNTIAEDMESDARSLEGQPFNSKEAATQFGNNCAAIQSIAQILAANMEAIQSIAQILAVNMENAERSNNCEEKTPWITDE